MPRIEWSDYLGNNATALEIVRRFHEEGVGGPAELVERCETAHDEVWEPVNIDWEALASALLRDAAEERVRGTELEDYEDVVFEDWPEGDGHLFWVATAPYERVLSWARDINALQETE